MSVQSDAATGLLEVNWDGLPEQAGMRGPDHAVVDLVRDGTAGREPGKTEIDVDARPESGEGPVDALPTEPDLQPREPSDRELANLALHRRADRQGEDAERFDAQLAAVLMKPSCIDRRDEMAPNAAEEDAEPKDGEVVRDAVPASDAATDAIRNGPVTLPGGRDATDESDDLIDAGEGEQVTPTAADSASGTPDMDESTADAETASPLLLKKGLESLLDELTGELVALEDFPHEIDDRAFEHEWLGAHNDISREAIREELLRTGRYTAHIDDAGNLLSDPEEYRLAVELGVQITLCVHRGRTEDQKREFILRSQTGKRMLTYEQQRELKNSLMAVRLLLGVDYDEIAKLAAVCPNTVRNFEKRAAADPNSKLEITKRPDRRYKPATLEKIAEAAELRKEGMGDAEIAAIFDTDVETVGKWLKDPPAGSKKKAKDESGKKPKTGRGTAPAQPQPIEDLAASDDMPELHRWTVERLGWFPEDYAQLEGECRDDAEEAVKKVSTVDGELLSHSIYGRHLIAFAEKVLEQRHRSVAAEDRGDEAPPDASGVIAEGDTDIARLALSEDGEEARVRVNGFDSETGPADRESMPQDNRTKALEPDVDDRCSPYEKHFGCKGGDK